jgi:hypothetical protein
METLDSLEKFTDWKRFPGLTSGLICPSIQIHSSEEADKAARDFSASRAAAYRLSTTKTTILDRIYEIPCQGRLLKQKKTFEICGKKKKGFQNAKSAVNWVTKTSRRMM